MLWAATDVYSKPMLCVQLNGMTPRLIVCDIKRFVYIQKLNTAIRFQNNLTNDVCGINSAQKASVDQ